jgi:hypothetical protein
LCNAEYELFLERTLELSDDEIEHKERYSTEQSHSDLDLGEPMDVLRLSEDGELTNESENRNDKILLKNMGGVENLDAQAKQHISQWQSHLDSMEKVTSISYLTLQTQMVVTPSSSLYLSSAFGYSVSKCMSFRELKSVVIVLISLSTPIN